MYTKAQPPRGVELTYQGFVYLVSILRDKLAKEGPRAPILYGVERGGVVPAIYLAHLLNCPFRSLRKCAVPHDEVGSDIVIVDDILDTGETYLRLHGSAARYAVLLSRRELPDVVYGELYNGDWITFPWEKSHSDHVCSTDS